MFNGFDWAKTQCNSEEELKSKFPINHIVGKKIKAMNMIGFVDVDNTLEIICLFI